MGFERALVISDNPFLIRGFNSLIAGRPASTTQFCFRRSETSLGRAGLDDIEPINVRREADEIISRYDLVISLHCQQVFPEKLVEQVRCINIHPGYNPHNRGWYPQVFSIINKLPLGATIHEMDKVVDHGRIIDRVEVPVYEWDTSLTAYERVLEAEVLLLEKNLDAILSNTYSTQPPESEGNLNMRKDYAALRELDLNETGTFRQFLDRLRALSHGDYQNGYFMSSNKKVFVRVVLELDQADASDGGCN